ncbi:MAG: pseudouridine synthase, partial [Planctomycetota bacterium]
PRVTDLVPPNQGRVFNVGRLDMSSEGLILLTNDGDLANRLTHPRHGVEKLYHVVVAGVPTAETLGKVRKGVYLDEGRVAFANVKVKTRRKASAVLEVVLDEGRNREIRRVLARVGHKVQRLERVAVGPVRLGEMPAGAYRPLTKEEVAALRQATVAKPAPNKASAEPKKATRPTKKRPKREPTSKSATKNKPAGRRIIGADDGAPLKKSRRSAAK